MRSPVLFAYVIGCFIVSVLEQFCVPATLSTTFHTSLTLLTFSFSEYESFERNQIRLRDISVHGETIQAKIVHTVAIKQNFSSPWSIKYCPCTVR